MSKRDRDETAEWQHIRELQKRKMRRIEEVCSMNTYELMDRASIVGFAVYIKGSAPCIGVTALVNQSIRFKIQIDDISVQCFIIDD